MKKGLRKLIAWAFAIIMVLQVAPVSARAMEIIGNATVYIRNEAGNSYLYADGSDVKSGSFQEKNAMYICHLRMSG